jgi:hypothetical protein
LNFVNPRKNLGHLVRIAGSGANDQEVLTHPKRSPRRRHTRRINGVKRASKKVEFSDAPTSAMNLMESAFGSLALSMQASFSTSESSENAPTITFPPLKDRASPRAISLILARLVDHSSLTGPNLSKLPKELKLQIFSHLDPIDATSLGLADGSLYVMYISQRGDTPVRLSTRGLEANALDASWELVGTKKCNQCGIYRCELRKHISGFFPAGYDYCRARDRFIPLSPIADIEDSSLEGKRVGCGAKPKDEGKTVGGLSWGS